MTPFAPVTAPMPIDVMANVGATKFAVSPVSAYRRPISGAMNELGAPFVRIWTYAGNVGGFPGQVFFCAAVVLIVVGIGTWLGNRK